MVLVENEVTTTAVAPDPAPQESKVLCLQCAVIEVSLVCLHYWQWRKIAFLIKHSGKMHRRSCNFLGFFSYFGFEGLQLITKNCSL